MAVYFDNDPYPEGYEYFDPDGIGEEAPADDRTEAADNASPAVLSARESIGATPTYEKGESYIERLKLEIKASAPLYNAMELATKQEYAGATPVDWNPESIREFADYYGMNDVDDATREQFLDFVVEAPYQEVAHARAREYMRSLEEQEKLNELGLVSRLGTLVPTILLDPLTLATGGAATAVKGVKAGAAALGAAAAAEQGLISANRPEQDHREVLIAALTGGVLGGLIGGVKAARTPKGQKAQYDALQTVRKETETFADEMASKGPRADITTDYAQPAQSKVAQRALPVDHQAAAKAADEVVEQADDIGAQAAKAADRPSLASETLARAALSRAQAAADEWARVLRASADEGVDPTEYMSHSAMKELARSLGQKPGGSRTRTLMNIEKGLDELKQHSDELKAAEEVAAPAVGKGEKAPDVLDSAGAARAEATRYDVEVNEGVLDDITDVVEAESTKALEAPQATSKVAAVLDKGVSMLSFGKVKNLRDLPLLRTVADRLSNSGIPQLAALSRRLFRDDVVEKLVDETVETTQKIVEARIAHDAMLTYSKAVKAFARDGGNPAEFGEMVGEAIMQAGTHPNVHVAKAVEAFREGHRRALEAGQAAGTFSKSIQEDDLYLHRQWRADEFSAAIAKHGRTKVIELFTKSLRSGLTKAGISADEIDDELVERIAVGSIENILHRNNGVALHTSHGLILDDLDALAKALDELGLSATEIESTISKLTRLRTVEKAGIGASKSRIKFNMDFMDEGTGLRMKDFIVKDITELFPRYANRVSRDVAMRRLLGVPATETGIQKIMKEVADLTDDTGIRHATEVALRDVAGLAQATGMAPQGLFPRISKTGRNFAYFTFGWAFGTASLAESSQIVAKLGIMGALKAIPELRRVHRLARDGKMSNEMLDFITGYLGLGADSYMRPMQAITSKFDNIAEDFVPAVTGIEKLGIKARDLTVKGSGLRGLTEWQKRMMPLLIMGEFERVMLRGGKLSRGQARRMAQMGYNERSLKALFEDMNRFGVEMHNFGRATRRVNLEEWAKKKPRTFHKFMHALREEADRAIIETSAGHLPAWMQNEMGKILGQFLGFTIHSYNTHFLRGLNVADSQAASNAIASAMIAALVGMGLNSLRFANDPNKLREEMSPGRLAMIGIARSSWGGVPTSLADSAFPAFGLDSPFSARHSSLGSQLVSLDSKPLPALINRGYDFATKLGQAAAHGASGGRIGKQLSGADFRRGIRLTPLTIFPSAQKAAKEGPAELLGLPYDDEDY